MNKLVLKSKSMVLANIMRKHLLEKIIKNIHLKTGANKTKVRIPTTRSTALTHLDWVKWSNIDGGLVFTLKML
jgi:hypothetical protein